MPFNIHIRVPESQAKNLADEINRQYGYSTDYKFDISERYRGEKLPPIHWLTATVYVRWFSTEEELSSFILENRLISFGRLPFVFQFSSNLNQGNNHDET